VDLALLIGSGGLDKQRILGRHAGRLRGAGRTICRRELELPPTDWQIPFQALAKECGLPADLAASFRGVREFGGEVLTR